MMIEKILRLFPRRPAAVWGLFFAYHAVVFYFTLLPGASLPPILFDMNDKTLHFAEFIVLYCLTAWAFLYQPFPLMRPLYDYWALIWALHIGAVTELIQGNVPGRYMSIGDAAANAAGCTAAFFVWHWIDSKIRKKQASRDAGEEN